MNHHDWASAGTDAFGYLALGQRTMTLRPRPPIRVKPPAYGFTAYGFTTSAP